jgi:hypothetical protein
MLVNTFFPVTGMLVESPHPSYHEQMRQRSSGGGSSREFFDQNNLSRYVEAATDVDSTPGKAIRARSGLDDQGWRGAIPK